MAKLYAIISESDVQHIQWLPDGVEGIFWLAFNPDQRKVFVLVTGKQAGLQAYSDWYGTRLTVVNGLGDLPQPAQWLPLVGDHEPDEDNADPQKHVKRLTRLRQRFGQNPDPEIN